MASSSQSPYISNYERMSGGCTSLIAAQIVSTISPKISKSSYILDNACGTGTVSEQIKRALPDAKILATDLNQAMIEEVQLHIKTDGWSNIETEILDIRALSSLPDNTFSHIITNLGLPIPGDPKGGFKAITEMFRVLQPDGVAVISTWSDRVWPLAFLNAARAIRPLETPQNSMALSPEHLRGSWLLAQLEEGGFGNNVEVKSCLTYTSANSLDEMADNMMLAKQMFFASYSEEELKQARMLLRNELPKLRTFEESDGEVRIGMKAWIGIGWKKNYVEAL